METLKKIGLVVGYSLLIVICLAFTTTLVVWPYIFYREGGIVACVLASIVTLFVLVLFVIGSLEECDTIFGAYCFAVLVTLIICGILTAICIPILLCKGVMGICITIILMIVFILKICE